MDKKQDKENKDNTNKAPKAKDKKKLSEALKQNLKRRKEVKKS